MITLGDEGFYEDSMSNTHDAISFGTFSRNVDIKEAKELEKSGSIIGPPIGMREFISQLNAM